ncbi:MAG TPA: NUDIX hydrolase N-terminal domain-containing protein [Myxococcaceae bacterium]|nr:NUDIX hydrolase N-terminal domain-containing protein [Myxococcaceae bacterium]
MSSGGAPGGGDWLEWVRRVQALAQVGLTYAQDVFDRQRYQELQSLGAQMMARLSGADAPTLLRSLEAERGYATPKLGVRGAVFRDDAILLVRERMDGGWSLPGGWVDVGDYPSEAIEREIREESGYEARATKLLGVYDRRKHGHPAYPHHVYILTFLCELMGGSPASSVETSEVGFFRETELPGLSVPRSPPELLARLFEHRRNPQWPTDFD